MKPSPGILIVEDEAPTAEAIRLTLESLGYRVVGTAATGEEALSTLKELGADLVLMDIGLSGSLDGIETASRIQAEFEIPVVYLTALADDESLERTKRSSPYGYILKPFHERVLHATLQTALNRKSREIADRRRAEESLRESERRYRLLAENVQDIIRTADLNLRFTYVSPSVERVRGYTVTEVMNQGLEEILTPSSLERARKIIAEEVAIEARPDKDLHRCRTIELEERCKDGSTIWTEVLISFLRDEQGRAEGILGVTREITENRNARKALEESEKRFRELAALLPEIVFEMDRDGILTFVNEKAYEISGYSREDFQRGFRGLDLIAPEDREAAATNILKQMSGCDTGTSEYTAVRKDGTRFPIMARTTPIFHGGELLGLRGILIDITDRKRTEEALLREKQFSDAVIRSLPGNFYVLDHKGRLRWWNRNMETSTGYSAEELSRMNTLKLFVEEDREKAAQKFDEAFATGKVDVESRLITKDGRAIPYHFVGMRVDIGPQRLLVGLGVDISEQKSAQEEKARMEAQLRQVQKMEAIGALAGGIAHDFNNILTAIIGYAELARIKAKDLPALEKDLSEVLRAANRAKELVKQILLFSRKAEQQRQPVRVSLIIKEVMSMIRASLPATIQIEQNIRGEDDWVLADPTQIHQIVINLCSNAKDAMEKSGGELRVSLTEEDLAADSAEAEEPGLAPGSYLKLSVSDTGHGMDDAVRERIFDPFFTTKGPHRGTGMGLSVVHGIVKDHGGTIRVWSEPGRGTTFEVLLPKIAEPKSTGTSRSRARKTRRQARILFVDDEPTLTEMYRRILEELGHEVVSHVNPLEALAAVRANSKGFDLVITDLTMPEMTGLELASALRVIRPEVPVVLCTGFREAVDQDKARRLRIRGVLTKPVEINRFAEAIEAALEGKGSASWPAGEEGIEFLRPTGTTD